MRIEFNVTSTSVPDAQVERNIAYARSLGLPFAARRASGRALNLIGRGPSVARHTETLKTDDADAWACGTAWAWCRDNGIEATLVCLDPHPKMADYIAGCERAILHPQCDPSVFAALEGGDCKLISPEFEECGSTAAMLALAVGVTLENETRIFGCEGSYAGTTHVDEDIPQPNEMFVRVNGEVFRTNTQMLIQSEQMAEILRSARPGLLVDRSGGLMSALVASGGEWDLVRWDNAPEGIRKMLEAA